MDEDIVDSRTLGVGKKRDLQDANQSQDGEPARDYDSSDQEQQRSRKRAKHSQQPVAFDDSEDGVVINTASPLPPAEILSRQLPLDNSPSNGQNDNIPASEAKVDSGDAPAKDLLVASSEVELPHASPAVQTEASRFIKGVSPATFNGEGEDVQAHVSDNPIIPTASTSSKLVPPAQEEDKFESSSANSTVPSASQADAQISPLPGWNGGIQSGLRTSFGVKSRTTSTKPVSRLEQNSNKSPTVPLGGTRSPSYVEKNHASSEDDIEDSANNSSKVGSGSLSQNKGIDVGSAPYVPLTKHERALLPVAEQQAHKAAHKAMMDEQRLQNWDRRTMQADKALAQEKTWPISNGPMLDMINHGRTYYARDVPKPLKYSNDTATFNVSPVWDAEGKPIKAQDFSFNRFAPVFIKKNLEKAANLNMDDLLSAFHTYCKKGFYRHLGARCQPLMDTVNAEDALSLEEAMELAGVYDSHPVTESDIAVAGIPPSAENSSQSERQTASATTSSSDSFVVLSKKAKGKLTPSELAVYEEKLREKTGVRAATEEADRVIRLVGRWPLPSEYASVSDSISKGNTFYARTPKNQKPYTKGGVEYQISELYGEGGIPLKAEDLSFNTFVIAFLKQNPSKKKRNTITMKHLLGAFGFYCSKFYNTVSQPIVMQSARAPDALTLEQAMKLASQASNSQTNVAKSVEQAPRERMQQEATEPTSLANNFVQEVESQISQHRKSARAEGINTTQSSSTDLGHGGRMVTLKQLANGANRIQPQEPSVSLAAAAGKQSKDISQPLPVLATNDNDTSMSDAMPLPSRNVDKGKSAVRETECMDDLFLQQKYFPSSEKISDRCLACAGTGHGSKDCPALECTICGMSGSHSNFTCPKNTRCQKCRQHGHQTSACPEKLQLSKSEAVPCDICGSKEHLEIACHFIWRSFAPGPEVKKVQNIPVHCYTCGGEGHYGSECGILTRPLRSGKVTWSESNAQKYIDPTSSDRALSAGIDYSIPKPTKQFSIKGMGGAGNPYTIDDSEEEGEFIRPKINNNIHDRGHIRIGETLRGNYPPPNDSYRPSDSRRGSAMSFNGAYDEDHAPYQIPYGGPSSYQQSSYNYNPGGQYPGQPANFGRNSHEPRMNRDHRPPVQNRYPTRQAMATAAVTNNKPKAKKKKDKKAKDKKRSGNGN